MLEVRVVAALGGGLRALVIVFISGAGYMGVSLCGRSLILHLRFVCFSDLYMKHQDRDCEGGGKGLKRPAGAGLGLGKPGRRLASGLVMGRGAVRSSAKT